MLLERHIFPASRRQPEIRGHITNLGFVVILHGVPPALSTQFAESSKTFSATSTAFKAELRRRLSQTAQTQNPPRMVGSARISVTSTSFLPAASIVPNVSSTSGSAMAG